MEIKFDITLQRLCILRISQAMWESNCTVKKLKKILLGTADQWTIKDEWKSVIKKVIKDVPATLLPTVFQYQLQYAVRDTGIRIAEWYLFLQDMNLFKHFSSATYERYLKTIYWTCYGTIDEEKTFRLVILTNPNIDIYTLFKMAAHYCFKDVLDDLWKKLPEKIQNKNYTDFYEKYDTHIIAYWFHYYTNSERELITDIMDSDGDMEGLYNEDNDLELNLVLAALKAGMHLALKYFCSIIDFEYIDINQHFDPLFQCQPTDKLIWKPQLVRDHNLQAYIFLYKEHSHHEESLTEVLVASYFSEATGYYLCGVVPVARFFLTNLFTSGPWQEFLLPAFESFKEYPPIYIWSELFPRLSDQLIEESRYGLPVEKGVTQKTFNQLWSKLKPDFKLTIAEKVIADLFTMWNIKTIKLVLNDKDLVDKRHMVLGYGNNVIFDLLTDYPCEIIDEYVEHLLINEEWNYFDQQSVREIYSTILHYECPEVDVILKSCYRFKKEQRRIKNLINDEVVCCYLLYYDTYESADKFLKWKHDSDDKIKNFKKDFKNKKFCADLIFSNWVIDRHDCDAAELNCNKFFKWSLSSDKEILDFKKKVLSQRLQPIQNFAAIVRGNYKVFDRFLNWCCFTSKEKDKLKAEYLKDCLHIFCESNIESARVRKVGRLLCWAFPKEEDRHKFVTDFMISENGLKAVKTFIIRLSVCDLKMSTSYELFEYFIEDWLMPLDESSREKILKILSNWNNGWSESYKESHSEHFNCFMDVLKKNLK